MKYYTNIYPSIYIGGCENKSALFILLFFIQNIHKIPTYYWINPIQIGWWGGLIVK